MAEIDTSSYPKAPAAPAQKSLLDTVGQFQNLESNKIAIDQAKLKQINDQFDVMHQTLGALIDENPTKQVAAERLLKISKTFGLKPEVTKHMMDELNQAPNTKSFAENAYMRGLDRQTQLNQIYGVPQLDENGQTKTNYNVSQMRGIRQTSIPRQQQIPPATPTVDADNRPVLQGPTPAITPPGTAATPTPLPSYVQPRRVPTTSIKPAGDTGTTINQTPNQVVQNRYPAPSGPVVGQPPLFEEGKKMLAQDQSEASSRMMAAKPAMQALPLMQTKGFLSGPGTEGFTKAASALKAWGLIDTNTADDPTAIRQEVNKKLAQYVRGSAVGQRSDADQALKEAGSPSAKVQILPALIKLTKDAVALDRVQAAMPNAFKDKDLSKYGNHRATFPQSVDEKAFTLDLEPEEKSKQLVDTMAKQLQSTNKREAAQADKFFKSLRIAKEQGFYQ